MPAGTFEIGVIVFVLAILVIQHWMIRSGRYEKENIKMTDRGTDLARLNLMGGNREITLTRVLVISILTIIIFVLALVSSTMGFSTLILAALASSTTCIFTLIQYSVSGPLYRLYREVQRLREELDQLQSQQLNG